jgi:hypothetical protein
MKCAGVFVLSAMTYDSQKGEIVLPLSSGKDLAMSMRCLLCGDLVLPIQPSKNGRIEMTLNGLMTCIGVHEHSCVQCSVLRGCVHEEKTTLHVSCGQSGAFSRPVSTWHMS